MAEETIVRIKLWAVVSVIVVVIGGLSTLGFSAILNHQDRIAKCETVITSMTADIVDIKQMLRDIRNDQIRRYNSERNGK